MSSHHAHWEKLARDIKDAYSKLGNGIAKESYLSALITTFRNLYESVLGASSKNDQLYINNFQTALGVPTLKSVIDAINHSVLIISTQKVPGSKAAYFAENLLLILQMDMLNAKPVGMHTVDSVMRNAHEALTDMAKGNV